MQMSQRLVKLSRKCWGLTNPSPRRERDRDRHRSKSPRRHRSRSRDRRHRSKSPGHHRSHRHRSHSKSQERRSRSPKRRSFQEALIIIMYLLVVCISLLLNFVPAQSRSIQNFYRGISEETDDSSDQDNVPVSAILEVNKHAVQGPGEPLIMFGDIAVATGLRNAAPCTAKGCKWPRSTDRSVYVPYTISKQYSSQEENMILKGLQSFSESTCIRFIPRKSEKDFIDIKSLTGHYSFVGRKGGGQDLSLDCKEKFNHRNIQHELLHALGFHHEQSRSDRDNHIQIIYKNIEKGMEDNFDKVQTNNLGTPYDYDSVMQYSRYAFSSNRQPTMIPIPDPKVPIGTAQQMSPNDILRINKLYCS